MRISDWSSDVCSSDLRETREDDAGSGNADRELPVEIAAHNLFGRAYAGVVLGIAGAEADDVVPGAHRHAAVERHRPHWCVRTDEADCRVARQIEGRHKTHELIACGAQALQQAPRTLRDLQSGV